MNRRKLKTTFFFLLTGISLSAQALTVDYYGIVGSSSNTNITKMAQDIFFVQLSSIDNISVNDKRPNSSKTLETPPVFTESENSDISFYAEILETRESDDFPVKWTCTMNAFVSSEKRTVSKTEIFDSYYKILSSAKSSLDSFFRPLKNSTYGMHYSQNHETAINSPGYENPDIQTGVSSAFDIESLAGTWEGEPFTQKIVILRGGRGFVIFKNGSTMNINISIESRNEGNFTLTATQAGRPNASFYPALPRELALEAAASAPPVKWTFDFVSKEKLTGKKETLVLSDSENQGGKSVIQGVEDVIWTKK